MAELNPQANTWQLPAGYTDLGWQLSRDNEALKVCREASHKRHGFDNSRYRYRCTDVISTCDECKNVYHTDMSD
jgi:hypothetical protein